MSDNRGSPSRLFATLAAIAAMFAMVGDSRLTASADKPPHQSPAHPAAQEHQTSLSPHVTVHNATPKQLDRLALAFERFSSIGLELPDLEVFFARDNNSCGDAGHGLFQSAFTPWRIVICPTELDTVYEHELAHAWERANLTEQQRKAFMVMREYEVWNDRTVPWNQRGIEGVAFIIQQGLSGLPLPPTILSEHRSRLEAFEFLTGVSDPSLRTWKLTYGSG